MSSAADAIRAFITPLLPGWHVQFGSWTDGSKTARYAVLKPAGGLPAELVRYPQLTLTLIGAEGEERQIPYEAANQVIEAMRVSHGALVSMQPGEPVPVPTADGRACFEIAISAITT